MLTKPDGLRWQLSNFSVILPDENGNEGEITLGEILEIDDIMTLIAEAMETVIGKNNRPSKYDLTSYIDRNQLREEQRTRAAKLIKGGE